MARAPDVTGGVWPRGGGRAIPLDGEGGETAAALAKLQASMRSSANPLVAAVVAESAAEVGA
eukprot:2706434-Prymnesium_polylepis.1